MAFNNFNIKTNGISDISKVILNGSKREELNWTEKSISNILCLPKVSPNIQDINQIQISANIDNVRLIKTPVAYKVYTSYEFFNRFINVIQNTPSYCEDCITNPLNNLYNQFLNNIVQSVNNLGSLASNEDKELRDISSTYYENFNSFTQFTINFVLNLNNLNVALEQAVIDSNFNSSLICQVYNDLINIEEELLNRVLILRDQFNQFVDIFTNYPENGLSTTPQTNLTSIKNNMTNSNQVTNNITDEINRIQTSIPIYQSLGCDKSKVAHIIPNAEGTCLSGRKLIIEGTLNQKILYTSDNIEGPLHTLNFKVPFLSSLIVYPKFEGSNYEPNIEVVTKFNLPQPPNPLPVPTTEFQNGFLIGADTVLIADTCEDFLVDLYIEDVFIQQIDERSLISSATIFLKAKLI